MEFKILNEEQFREFSKNHKYESFMQTVELGNLKNELGNTIHYVGVFKNKKLNNTQSPHF